MLDNNDVFYAEVSVLSSVIRNPILLEKPELETLQPFMFSSVPHKNIYNTVLEIKSQQLIPDFHMLVTKLTDTGLISQCGGLQYIKYLAEQNFSEDNFTKFVASVVNSYKVRELSKISESMGSDLNIDGVDNLIANVKNKLTLLEMGTNLDGNVISIDDANKSMILALQDRMNSVEKIAHSTNIPSLDGVTGGYVGGDLWVYAGRPGMGKTSVICNSVLSGVPSLFFSLEMRHDSLAQRIISIKTGIPVFNIRLGKVSKQELEKIQEVSEQIKTLPLFLDTSFYISPEYLLNTIRKYKKMHDIRVVYLDYIQLMVERSNNATHDIGRVTRDLKLIANSLDITVAFASQLNRNVESRENKRPMLADLRQSGNIEEDADVVVGIYRDVIYNSKTLKQDEMELLILKQRQGPTGSIFVNFNDNTNMIYEKDKK